MTIQSYNFIILPTYIR